MSTIPTPARGILETRVDICSWFLGCILSVFCYGMVFVLSLICFRLLYRTMSPDNRRTRIALMMYLATALILNTIFVVSSVVAFVKAAHLFESNDRPIIAIQLALLTAILAHCLNEGLLSWRCAAIHMMDREYIWPTRVSLFTLFAVQSALGIIWFCELLSSSVFVWTDTIAGYLWLSLGINVLISTSIVVRLLVIRRRISAALGTAHGAKFITPACIITESCVLYSMLVLLVLIPAFSHNTLRNTFLNLLGVGQTLPPLLTIYRVASGKAQETKSPEIPSTISLSTRPLNKRYTPNVQFDEDAKP